MNTFDLINIAFLPTERRNDFSKRTAVSSAIPEEKGPQQPMCRCPDLVEGPASSSPCSPTAGTAGVGVLSEREHLRLSPAYERFIAQLHELLSNDRFDEAHDLVRAEHRAIQGRV